MKKFYLTTTLPYANAEPHMGHTLEFIHADIIVRYMRNGGANDVFFNVGTDEHGLKMYQKALETGKAPKDLVDFYANKFKEFCNIFNISYDNFYRTSDVNHKIVAQEFWNKSLASGDVYKKKYEGLYCVGCESFKIEKDLVDGKCPDHNKEPINYSEENWFFKLSKYRDVILNYIDKNPEFISPSNKTEELKNFVKEMEDISISRLKSNLPWGIDVPGDDSQVMYVWFDALTNYIGAIGFPDKLNQDYAQNMYQICGPDNLRFQGGIWQAMLASAGFDFSRKIIVHGTILGPDGIKMSKTIGNVVSPFEQLEKYGYEAIRFYLASSFGFLNSPYKEEDLVNIYNSLADSYGNLLNRVIHLSNAKGVDVVGFIDKWENGSIKDENIDRELTKKISEFGDSSSRNLKNFNISAAVFDMNSIASLGNNYIQENAPWEKEKSQDEIEKVLKTLLYLLHYLSGLYEYIIPESAEKALNALRKGEKIILFNKLELKK